MLMAQSKLHESESTGMRVELAVPAEPSGEPHRSLRHEQTIAMVLRPGSVDVGLRRSEMTTLHYDSGEIFLCHRHVQKWVRTVDLHFLAIAISDVALAAACGDETAGEVQLSTGKVVDPCLASLTAAVNAERLAGFPSGQLFLDSVEQALAVALVSGHALRRPSQRIFRGGLAPARLRKVTELVYAKIEDDLTLEQMAQSVGLSVAHFAQMFRKSTGESPHQFVLKHRVERAKQMLLAAETRVLDVAVACGFKTQQHFARVFRSMCGASPTEYRQELLHLDEPAA